MSVWAGHLRFDLQTKGKLQISLARLGRHWCRSNRFDIIISSNSENYIRGHGSSIIRWLYLSNGGFKQYQFRLFVSIIANHGYLPLCAYISSSDTMVLQASVHTIQFPSLNFCVNQYNLRFFPIVLNYRRPYILGWLLRHTTLFEHYYRAIILNELWWFSLVLYFFKRTMWISFYSIQEQSIWCIKCSWKCNVVL